MGGSIIKSLGPIFFSFMTIFIGLLLDLYVFSGLVSLMKNRSKRFRMIVYFIFWTVNVVGYVSTTIIRHYYSQLTSQFPYSFITALFFLWFIIKLFFVAFLLVTDILSFFRWLFFNLKQHVIAKRTVNDDNENENNVQKNAISRSEFLLKTSTIIAAVPAVALSYGIISGAHDYRVRRERIVLPRLPKSFDGFKIAQISDIHSGSFWNKTAVQGGIEMLMLEKPDIILFTGDLVNSLSSEMDNYFNVFNKLKADFGVHSVLGNHDYGTYVKWDSRQAQIADHARFLKVHDEMGWNLMLNQNHVIEQSGDKIGLIGVENWSSQHKRFPTYGDLKKAKKGMEEMPVKILMSHEPYHWQGEILPLHKDIDLTLSGHTHGMQFGIEMGDIKWSPVQYFYKEWAGLYQQNNQYLYVNRGYGYLGYPGRFGILPEITILELSST